MMIARTEIMRALNDGRQAGWHDEVDRGRIDAELSVKEWVPGPDACDECTSLEGYEVEGVDALFDTDFGKIAMPPAHPHCRCSVTLHPMRMADLPDVSADEIAQAQAEMGNRELAKLLDNIPG
jgi:hypothetical protein